MNDPIARPGNGDAGIEQAAERVVEAWELGSEGKDPTAIAEDFARMREGFGVVTAGGAPAAQGGEAADTFTTTSTREGQLRHAGDADATTTAQNRAETGVGPDG